MHRIKLVIEYNGKEFHGWQKQPQLRTVQEELHNAIELVTKQRIKAVVASGRTDAGVHARAQVVAFTLHEMVCLSRLKYAVSSILRNEVAVVHADEVALSFHPLRDSIKKQYEYLILNRQAPPVLLYGRCWHIPHKLDCESMQKAAQYLVGVHDFSSFRASGCHAHSPVKEILTTGVHKDDEALVSITVTGTGFLKQMIRIIVGTLVNVGKGILPYSAINDILNAKERRRAGPTAPAYGLCLNRVWYPHSIF